MTVSATPARRKRAYGPNRPEDHRQVVDVLQVDKHPDGRKFRQTLVVPVHPHIERQRRQINGQAYVDGQEAP